MKKYIFLVVSIFILFLSFNSCDYPEDICGGPGDYPYDPFTAGVDVSIDRFLTLNVSKPPSYPQLCADENYIYIPVDNKILIFTEDLTLDRTITIDASVDLSVDLSVYQFTGSGLFVHDNKVVMDNYFVIKQDNEIIDVKVIYLQMNKDGTNRKLVTFSEDKYGYIDYNVISKKVMIFSKEDGGDKKVSEYEYDNLTENYVFDNSYDLFSNILVYKYRFNENTVWNLFLGGGEEGLVSELSQYAYEYIDNKIIVDSTPLDLIQLNYLHMAGTSDFAIVGDYIWLLSQKDEHNNTYRIMKVKPLP